MSRVVCRHSCAVIVLGSGECFEDMHSELLDQEELERVFTACRELAAWLEDKGFDLESLLEEDGELVDNALWLYYLLEDVLRGDCRLAGAWASGQEGVCKDVEAMYFECTHRDIEGRMERYKRVAMKMGSRTLTAEMPEQTNTH